MLQRQPHRTHQDIIHSEITTLGAKIQLTYRTQRYTTFKTNKTGHITCAWEEEENVFELDYHESWKSTPSDVEKYFNCMAWWHESSTILTNLAGDLCRLGGDDGERPLTGDAGLLLGGVSPRRYGDSTLRRTGVSALRRGGESTSLLGETPLLGAGDLLLGGGETAFRRGATSEGLWDHNAQNIKINNK